MNHCVRHGCPAPAFPVCSATGAWHYISQTLPHQQNLSRDPGMSTELANMERGMRQLRFGIANCTDADP